MKSLLDVAIEKLKELPEEDRERIAGWILEVIEKGEIKLTETMLLSEKTLAEDWLKPEEDEAWKNL